MKTHPIHLYQNKPGASNSSTSEAWQLCGFLTSAPFYFPASLSCTPLLPLLCGLLITPVSPRAVSPLSQSSPVTHHLVLYLLFSLPTPLLGEAPETRQWLLPTTAHPVFTAVAVYPSADGSHHEGDKKKQPHTHRGPFVSLYTLHTWPSVCRICCYWMQISWVNTLEPHAAEGKSMNLPTCTTVRTSFTLTMAFHSFRMLITALHFSLI